MLEEALEIATDPDYRFDIAVQLGKLEVAKVWLRIPPFSNWI
jgi:coatomer subunit beta'